MSLTEYPITEPVVMARSIGKHGRFEPLANKVLELGGLVQIHSKNAAISGGQAVVHAPMSYLNVAKYAPRGVWEVTKGSWRWFTDSDGRKALRGTFEGEESFIRARQQHREEIKARAFVSLFSASVASGLGAFAWFNTPDIVHTLSVGGFVGGLPLSLGLLARPENAKPKEGEGWRNKRGLNSDDFVQAIRDLRIPEVEAAFKRDPEGKHVGVKCGIDGRTKVTTAMLRLPGGARVSTVIKGWETVCSSLDVHPSQVIISKGDTGSRVIIQVHPKPVSQRKPKMAPVMSRKSIVFHEEIPLGYAMDTEVCTQIPQAMLIVSASGSGKTELLRNITCAALRDPLTDTFLWDGKGGGDYANLIPSLRGAILGDAEHDPEAMRAQAERLIDRASAEAAIRSEKLLQMGKSSVSPEVPGFNTIVLIFDEAQYLGKELLGKIKTVAYKCRSTNIKIILAVQEIDGTVVEYSFAGASCWRRKIVLKLSRTEENTALLGNSAIRRGFDGTDEEHQPGQAILVDNGLRRFQVTEITEEQQRSVVEQRGIVEKVDFAISEPIDSGNEHVDSSNMSVEPVQRTTEVEHDIPEPQGDGRNLFADIAQTQRDAQSFAPTAQIVERLVDRYPGMTEESLKKTLKPFLGSPKTGKTPCKDITCEKSVEGKHDHTLRGFYYDDINTLLPAEESS